MTALDVFLLITSLFFLVLFIRANSLLKKQRKIANDLVNNRENLLKERDALINKLELESLKFQVSPHSLRNTLNVVKYYTETSNLAIGRLTNVLDYLLYESAADSIPLKDEVKFLKNFHDLMKIRTSELTMTKFNDNISDDPRIEKLSVPPMLTAYFLENAYKHGELTKEGEITVSLSFTKDEFVYVVENTMREEKTNANVKGGIGLKNMKKRLDIIYKDSYSFETVTEGDVYRSELKIKI